MTHVEVNDKIWEVTAPAFWERHMFQACDKVPNRVWELTRVRVHQAVALALGQVRTALEAAL